MGTFLFLLLEASSAVLCKPAFVKKWEEKEKKKRIAIKSSTANVSKIVSLCFLDSKAQSMFIIPRKSHLKKNIYWFILF